MLDGIAGLYRGNPVCVGESSTDVTREFPSMRRRIFLGWSAASGILAIPGFSAQAQERYPDRPIRLIVPFAPGGETDLFARQWALRVAPVLGGTINVDNRAGGGGVIGATEVARARPDGYTLLACTTTTQVINPLTMAKPPYDPERDFTPIQIISTTPTTIVLNPAFGPRNLTELVARLKAEPGKHAYGSAGAGTITNLTGELFKSLAGGLAVQHVPYKGAGPGLQDVIAGHIPMFTPILSTSLLAHHRAGRIRIVALNSEARIKAAPDIPTAVEQGLAGMLVPVFNMIAAPIGTPAAIVEALHQATLKIKADPAYLQEVEAGGGQLVTDSDPARAARYIRAEVGRWAPIIKATGFKME